MSNHLAIAAVTATIQRLLTDGLSPDVPDISVTARPPDRARQNQGQSQLNLFLFQLLPDPALRNMDLSPRVKPGETVQPPVALGLRYLLTAYAANDDELSAHKVLGRALQVLNDRTVLDPAVIRNALAGNDLHQQVEHVRLSVDLVSLDDLHKLWATFQTQYRLSAALQVSAVLIESRRAVRAPLPVLERKLVVAQGTVPPYPRLEAAVPPARQPSIRLGDVLTLTGHDLSSPGAAVRVRFTHPRWTAPEELAAASSSRQQVTVAIPGGPLGWPAGVYGVSVVVARPGEPVPQVSNELTLSLAPRITSLTATRVGKAPNFIPAVTVVFTPQAWVEQPVLLILGDRGIPEPARAARVGTITFPLPGVASGTYSVRLRVDGEDSILVDHSGPVPVLDPLQRVTLP
ncbi:MAG TPA: DUF4255 domain-containing protein [Myxococcaceae bacterium]